VYEKPWAGVSLQPMTLMSASDPPVFPNALWATSLMRQFPFLFKMFSAMGKAFTCFWFSKLTDLRDNYGIKSYGHPVFEGQFSPYLNLALFSKQIGDPQDDWPENTVQTGFIEHRGLELDDETMPQEIVDFLASGPPPIVATLGTAAVRAPGNFYTELLAGLEETAERAIVLVGKQADKSLVSQSPRILLAPYAPYQALFKHAKLIIHQCGMGTSAQALRSGRPQLMVPFAFDQPDNAHRLKALGVGDFIYRHRFNRQSFLSILKKYTDTSPYLVAAKRQQKEMEKADDAMRTACHAMETLVKTHSIKAQENTQKTLPPEGD
jgi:UDP:flavonoid glycosyltransferase YjiC (YdhE family)